MFVWNCSLKLFKPCVSLCVKEPDEASKTTKSILHHWEETKNERTAVAEEAGE